MSFIWISLDLLLFISEIQEYCKRENDNFCINYLYYVTPWTFANSNKMNLIFLSFSFHYNNN